MSDGLRDIKTRQQHWEHFKTRFKARYGFTILEKEYDALFQNYTGVFTKGGGKTIGYTYLRGVKVWVLYIGSAKCMATCYPPDIETELKGLIRSCFGSALSPIAKIIYNSYVKESASVRMDFESEKEAAIYYFENTLFPTLHIEKFKHGEVRPFDIMFQIKRVIECTSSHITLTVAKLKEAI